MASPCIYTYKGQEYTYAEFRAALADGLLKELTDSGAVDIGMPTELTHKAIDVDRKKLGLPEISKTSFENAKDFEDASKEYKETHLQTAQQLVQSRKPATRKEAYVISLGIVDLKKQLAKASQKMIEAKTEEEKQSAYAEMQVAEANLDTAHQALKNATSEAGRVLRMAQDAIREDMSLDNTLRIARAYAKDNKLTAEERKNFEDITSKLEEAQKLLAEHEEALSKAEAQKAIDDLAIQEKIKAGVESEVGKIAEKLPAARKVMADKAIKALDSFQAKIRANNYSSVPVAIIDTAITTIKLAIKAGVAVADAVELGIDKVKELHGKWEAEDRFRKDMLDGFAESKVETKERGAIKLTEEGKIKGLNNIVKDLIKKGFTDINDIVKEIKKDVPDMTEREIRDEISGYGKVSKLSDDPINTKLREVKRVGKLITQKEKALANEALLRSGLQRDLPTAKEIELQKEINQILKDNQMATEAIPKTDAQWKTLLDKYKTRLEKRIAELQEKADKQDYEEKKRAVLKLDPEALELKRKVDKLMAERKKAIEKIRLENRSAFEKITDTVTKALRFSILSGFVTPLLKLGVGAGLVRSAVMTPLETLATASWSHLPGLRKIAEQAPRYSGDQSGPLAKGIAEWWSKGTAQDIKNIAKGGKLEMDILYGKNDQQPASLWDVWGQFHKILKTPAKRAEFATSFEMNLNWEAKQKNELGEYNDIKDPIVQLRAAARALADSDRAIFMQDNPLSTGYKMFLKGLERDLADGSTGGKILSKLAQMDMLIVKVPTNFVSESASYLPGGGALKAVSSLIKFRKDLNSLKPEQADYISRAISKQMIGAAAFGIGYYLYKNMGGNYVQGQPTPEKPKAGEMKIGNVEIPHSMQHSVFAQAIQLGATMAWAEEFYKKKGEPTPKMDAYATMVTSLIKQNPFVQEAETVTKALNSTSSKAMWAATIVARLESPAKWFAEHFDKDANGEPIKRVPKTWQEVLEMPIPGLRQNVGTAWDAIDAQRTKMTKLQELKETIKQEEANKYPNETIIRNAVEAIDSIEKDNKQKKIDKLVIDEQGYYDLAKALGKTPHAKRGLSKDEQKAVNKLKLK